MNRVVAKSLFAWIWLGLPLGLLAQEPAAPTLSQKLLAEGSTPLARAAREKGDSVRGAILYSQKKLNCTGCHGRGAKDLLGPDLTQMPGDVADEYFVEAILEPSKAIKKGYESVAVLTAAGRVITGRIVEENAQGMTLRETPNNRIRKFPLGAIEAVNRTPKSAMPSDLADQLDDRQQFLDLVKYLMDIAGTGASADVRYSAGGGKVGKRILGMALLDQHQCRRCHEAAAGLAVADPNAPAIPPRQAPDLTSAANRIDPHYLQRYIADPLQTKPGTSMPDVMGAMEPADKQAAAEAITHFLISLNTEPFQRTAIDSESGQRGKELFHTVGCVACHSPRNDERDELLADNSVPLGRIDTKYSHSSLLAFLKDPHSVRPQGRMPNMKLTHWEATDLANYLLQPLKTPDANRGTFISLPLDRSLAETGKRQFRELGCLSCHKLPGNGEPLKHLPLANLDVGEGCLSGKPGPWPNYALDEVQRDAIVVAMKQHDQPLSSEERVTLAMESFRCFACHSRGEIGGVTDLRDQYFHTDNENLGPQGRIPPTLTAVGSKLKPKWMRQVLVSGRAIRPYVKTRMPQYGTANVSPMVDLFAQVDQIQDVTFGHHQDEKEAKKTGTELVGRRGLNCVACHTFQQKPAQTMPAVDLTEMSERLHKEWFYRYMLSPQKLSPGTVMPSFWPGGKAIRQDIFAGDPKQQLEAIWLWMKDGRQARTPPGLRFEPIELLAKDEAVMLRRSYQGIGKRGIGVGYPGGVNVAFDAEQMRLAMIWKGKFADPGGVWRGQGSGTVRPLGSDLIRFEQGPELGETPWESVEEVDRPKTHQFRGYDLDELRRPTFLYQFDGVKVRDKILADTTSEDASVLLRTLTLESEQPREGLFFRLAKSADIEVYDDLSFVVGKQLKITIDAGQSGKVIDPPTGKHLVIPLAIPAGTSELVIRYAW